MRRQTIIDVVPITRNGNVVYMETQLGSLGTFVNTAGNITNVTTAAAAAVPTGKITAQSDFSKTANVVATGATVVAAATVAIVPFGTVVAAVAGIVAAAAVLLGKIFGNSKAKAYAAERAQYETVNSQIAFENQQLDLEYAKAKAAIDELRNKINIVSGLGIVESEGLGLCILNCKKKEEAAKLNSAKAQYEVLVKEQENKTKLMATLLEEYNKLMKTLLELKKDKSINDYMLWILGGSAALIAGYLAYENRSAIKKQLK